MSTKYLFSDIDGTLVQNGLVDVSTVNKIKNFIQEGNKFYLCSGRLDYEIQFILEKLDIQSEYRISQNGAVVTDANNNVISSYVIPESILPGLMEDVCFYKNECNLHFEASSVDSRYCIEPRPSVFPPDVLGKLVIDNNLVENLSQCKIKPTILLLVSHDYEILLGVQKKLKEKYKDTLAIFFTSNTSLEISNADASKGNAISDLLEKRYSINNSNVFVVGDSENDLSMFLKFSNSFVMQNAKPNVREFAFHGADKVGDVIDYINKDNSIINSRIDILSKINVLMLKNQLIYNCPQMADNVIDFSNFEKTTKSPIVMFNNTDEFSANKHCFDKLSILRCTLPTKPDLESDGKEASFLQVFKNKVFSRFKRKIVQNNYSSMYLKDILNIDGMSVVFVNADVDTGYYTELEYLLKFAHSVNSNILIVAQVSSLVAAVHANNIGFEIIYYNLNKGNLDIVDQLITLVDLPVIIGVSDPQISVLKKLFSKDRVLSVVLGGNTNFQDAIRLSSDFYKVLNTELHSSIRLFDFEE